MADAKLIKEAIKEGGKKGVDMAGVSDLGGVVFFNIAVDTPNGDLALLEKVIEGANAEVDESAEERKGGAGALGKMFFSAGDSQLAIMGHVPAAIAGKLSLKEWAEAIANGFPNAYADPKWTGEIVEINDLFCKIVAKGNPDAGLFPLKMRDAATASGVAILRAKDLIPADDDSDDDVNYAEAAGVEW